MYWQNNIFDAMVALAPPNSTDLGDELDRCLCTDVEHVTNPLAWWYKWHAVYPCLSCMALDYLTIPGECCTCCQYDFSSLMIFSATSINIEQLFSRGCLIGTHTCSQLSAQVTRALLCLGAWSHFNLIKTEDVFAVAALKDVKEGEEALEDKWDDINLP